MLGQSRRRRLRTERLEPRNLMALVAMDLQIFEDIDGQPGAPLVRPLESGESCFLEIKAVVTRVQIACLGGVSLDIMWNTDHLRSLESNDTLTAAITDDLPMFRSGTLQSDLGRILNLSGASYESAGVGRRIGDGQFEHFAYLRFEAIAPTSLTEITLLEGISQTATYPALSLRHEDHDFDVEMIEIVAADPQTTLPEQAVPDPPVASPEDEVLSPETSEPTNPDVAEPLPNPETPEETTLPIIDESNTADDAATSNDTGSDVTLSLVADATGEVQIGDLITIDVQVSESDPEARGVGGISVDVDWDPSELQLVNPDSITDAITENFPGFQGGSVDTAAGFIDELTGASFESAGIGRAIGDGVAETFVTLTFVALKPTDGSAVTVSLGDGGVGLVGDTSGAPIDVADAETNVEIATAALPPLIQISTSGTDGGLEFAASGNNGVQSTLLRPGSVDSLQYIEIANVGETVLEVYEIQLGVDGLSIAASDLALADGFTVAPGQSQRIAVEFTATESGSFNASEGIVVVSNAGNRGRYAINTTAETTFAADLNLDGQVNVADVVLLDSVFGQTRGDGLYSEAHDPNLDGSIDLGDFGLLNAQFGMQQSSESFAVDSDDDDEDPFDSTLDLLALDALANTNGVN